MLKETPNDGSYWKDKLDNLENLPGNNFDNELAWSRLHQRLHKKSSNKKIVWYWAAAAIFLFILTIPFLTIHKKEYIAVKANNAKVLPQKIESSSSAIDKNSLVKIENIYSSKKKISIINERLDKKNHNSINKNVADNFRIADTVSNQSGQQKLYSSLHSIDTMQKNIVLITEPKKKLKVVHINELGDATEEQPAMVRSMDTHAFQLKFANQEVFLNHSVNSKATEFTILKTKSSTN